MKLFLNILKVFGLIILSLICNSISVVLLARQSEFSELAKWGFGIAYIIFLIAVIYGLWKWHSKYEEPTVRSQKMTGRDIGIALLFFLAMRVVAIVGTLAISAISGQSSTANDAALQGMTAFLSGGFFLYTWLYVILVGIAGPIIEELAYRAFPNHLIFKQDKKILAGIVTTVVFALPHSTTVPEFILYALIGAMLYMAYLRRGNIRDSMLAHILNNLPSALYFLFLSL